MKGWMKSLHKIIVAREAFINNFELYLPRYVRCDQSSLTKWWVSFILNLDAMYKVCIVLRCFFVLLNMLGFLYGRWLEAIKFAYYLNYNVWVTFNECPLPTQAWYSPTTKWKDPTHSKDTFSFLSKHGSYWLAQFYDGFTNTVSFCLDLCKACKSSTFIWML